MQVLRIILLIVTAVSLVVFLYALSQIDAPLPVAVGPPVVLISNFVYIWISHPGQVAWAKAEKPDDDIGESH
jgi:hypothetical protein